MLECCWLCLQVPTFRCAVLQNWKRKVDSSLRPTVSGASQSCLMAFKITTHLHSRGYSGESARWKSSSVASMVSLVLLPRDAMHKRGYSRHAESVSLSVRLSVTFVDHVKANKHIFKIFLPSGSHTILVFPYETGWRYSDGNPPNGGVECRWGIGRNGNSGLIAGYRRLLDVRSGKNIYWRVSWVYDTVGHAPLAIYDCWTCELRSDKNSYWRPYSVDRTVGDASANICLWRPAAWTNTPKRP